MRLLASACLILASCAYRLQAEDKFSATDPTETGKYLSAVVSTWKEAGKVSDGNSLAAKERQTAIAKGLDQHLGKWVYYQFKVESVTPKSINVEVPKWMAGGLSTGRSRSQSGGKKGNDDHRVFQLSFHGDWAKKLKQGDTVCFVGTVREWNLAQGYILFGEASAEPGKDSFTTYEGKWLVKYDNNYTHEYEISADGALSFNRYYSPNGTPSIKKDEQKASLSRMDGAVLVPFANGKLVERFKVIGDKLMVDRFDPISLYPKLPNNKGVGVREK